MVALGTKMPEARGTGTLSWPMSRGSISSRYGMRRGRMHSGVDIAAPVGSPITAADSGVVTMAEWYGSYGRAVIIDHGNGISTLYGHCSEILVRVGNKVSKGQLIARWEVPAAAPVPTSTLKCGKMAARIPWDILNNRVYANKRGFSWHIPG